MVQTDDFNQYENRSSVVVVLKGNRKEGRKEERKKGEKRWLNSSNSFLITFFFLQTMLKIVFLFDLNEYYSHVIWYFSSVHMKKMK